MSYHDKVQRKAILSLVSMVLFSLCREDDDEEDDKNTQSLLKFMGKKDDTVNRHRYFKERCLSNVTNL